ncbi:phosphoethanolamine transferase class o [Lasallia pustulata]|uniref:Phosphoethanolamine transferase class o n=1 Tax=Lasallia pustulata TaxID=136370 RepID=A0A1W5D7H4_9LECA|nr:phosphoethanolamine transferase class o [Lasallia pustulata]
MSDGSIAASPEYKRIAGQFASAKAHKTQRDSAEAANKLRERQFKASHAILLVFFLWIFCIHALGIYFFAKGFLLTRLVLDFKSECAVPPLSLPYHDLEPSLRGCWHPKTFNKAIVVIVDALRYDFTVPFDDHPHHFHNALQVLHETATKQPHNAFLLPFIADPPTTTLQRLKGLTTGTLPTFIDAGSNFAGTAIEEDNLVTQLRDAGKTLVHLGDDTWHSLFPGYFDANLTHAYDSFNVWDLHTVDNGVTEHLMPLLDASNTSKWDVIFGHYLGVDHAGHRYGPDHPAMAAKLKQMDAVFRQIITPLDEETLLVIMGDHGMDVKGDHGGDSDDEVEAALWMYSKRGIFGRSCDEHVTPPKTAKIRPVGQIDLVPTLSLLLGLPIPFNNLGTPIEEAFLGRENTDWYNLASVNALTSAQVKRYQHEYALARGLDEGITSGPLALWRKADGLWRELLENKRPSADQLQEAAAAFTDYQTETLRLCRSLWARFDIPSMLHGIEIVLAGVLILAVFARFTDVDRTELVPVLLKGVVVGSMVGASFGVLIGLVIPTVLLLDGSLLGVAAGGILGAAYSGYKMPGKLLSPFPDSIWGWLSIIFTVAPSIGFASNSYTIWEDEILTFFLCTFALLALASSFRQPNPTDRAIGVYQSALFLLLTRLASFPSSTSAPWHLLIPFLLASLLPDIIKTYYAGTRSYTGPAPFCIGLAFRSGLLLSALFWALDVADDADWLPTPKPTLKLLKTSIAQFVLALAFAAGSSAFVWANPCIDIQLSTTTPQNPQPPISPSPSSPITIPGPPNSQSLTILGYANTHGTRFFLLLPVWALALLLLQKPIGAAALACLLWQILALAEIVATNSLTHSAIGPIVLALLGGFHFFKTGHQATLSSIQWDAAFIPLAQVRYPWAPILVVLNTFGAQILAAIAVPLLVLWKRPPRGEGGERGSGVLSEVAKAVATHVLWYAVGF